MKTLLYIICVACIAVLAISRIGYYSSSRHGGAGYNTQGSKSGLPSWATEPVLANAYRLDIDCIKEDSISVVMNFSNFHKEGGKLIIMSEHKAFTRQPLSIKFAVTYLSKESSDVIIQLLEEVPRHYTTPCTTDLLSLQYVSTTLKKNGIDTFNNKRVISLENWEPI